MKKELGIEIEREIEMEIIDGMKAGREEKVRERGGKTKIEFNEDIVKLHL